MLCLMKVINEWVKVFILDFLGRFFYAQKLLNGTFWILKEYSHYVQNGVDHGFFGTNINFSLNLFIRFF